MRFRRTLLAAMTATFAIHGLKQSCADLTVHGMALGLDVGRYDRFAGNPGFIGAGMDWSGIGRATATSGGPGWATMISPSFFVTAAHTVVDPLMGAGKTLRFYANNNVNSAVDRTIATGWPLGNDLWLGKLSTPVPDTIHTYPILNIQNPTDYVGQEIYVYGQSADIYANRAAQQRLGRNVISSYNPTDQRFGFTYSASVADIGGPNGISDGAVDSHDWDVFEANFGMGSPTHLDGDVNNDGAIDLNDGKILFNEGIAMTTVTSGLGWDEAMTQGGDSGGPSFRVINGKPALTGLHTHSGFDRQVGISFNDIVDAVILNSGGSERPISMTGKRSNFFASKDGFSLPSGLQKLNVFPGDLDGDFIEDAVDINLLNREISAVSANPLRPVNLGIDFNNDGDLDASDRTVFLEDVLGTFFGDANLDGVVTQAGDIDPSLANIGKSPAQWTFPNDNWRSGDFNGDGVVNLTLDILPALTFASSAYKGLRRINPDFISDGVLDQLDIEVVAAAARAGIDPDSYDFTGDGIVNEDDRVYFIEEILGALIGDRDLSGGIHVADVTFPQSASATWASGDMDGDGDADQADYDIILNAINTGNNIAPPGDLPGLPIPEPASASLAFLCLLGLISQRHNSRLACD
jgi:hypothetical protein